MVIHLKRSLLKCKFFNINHAEILLEDAGALPFTLASLLNCCKRILPDLEKEFLLPLNEKNYSSTTKERLAKQTLSAWKRTKVFINGFIHRWNNSRS
jgi:hypothetical protein